MLNQQIKETERKLDELCAAIETATESAPGQICEQRDVAILRSCPGLGRINIATLLGEVGEPLRQRDYQVLRVLSGQAPVTRRRCSILVPMLAGNIVARFRRDEMATHVWLVGLIWLLIVSLWVLDMPTGPNACYQCSATEKLTRTFFSLPRPSGLVDDNGPFFGTWPAAALLGYSIGARLALRRRRVTA